MPTQSFDVSLPQGTLRGVDDDGVTAFRGIPYAASPVGELRFRPPGLHPGWHGVRDAATPGPSVPQLESRLQNVMGPSPVDWNEDGCLNLNVWSPAGALTDGRPRPVLVWIHGGGWSSGSGGWEWYDGARLAARGDIVVVTVNYRLAALGYLWLPEVGSGNLGNQDQGAALRWVRDNVSAFGGDPTDITVGGQSAGAHSAVSLALDPATRPVVKKVIAQSGPWVVTGQHPQAAATAADEYLALLGITRDDGLLSALQDVPVDDLLAAYHAQAQHPVRAADPTPAMYPVLGGTGLPRTWIDGLDRGGMAGIPLLIGRTEHEMSAFVPGLHAPEDTDDATRAVFDDGIVRMAETLAAQGNPAHVYRFARRSSSTETLGATHCAELPFTFDNLATYASTPMTGPVDDADQRLADEFSTMIATFVGTGLGDESGWPAWQSPHGRHVQLFGGHPADSVALQAGG